MKFLLDANFLMIPGKFKVDVFSELQKFGKPELCTLDIVVKELERLSKSSGKDSRYAKIALLLIQKKGIGIIKTKGVEADKTIETIAKGYRNSFIVCTQDRALIKKLREAGIPVVYLRQKKYLEKL